MVYTQMYSKSTLDLHSGITSNRLQEPYRVQGIKPMLAHARQVSYLGMLIFYSDPDF